MHLALTFGPRLVATTRVLDLMPDRPSERGDRWEITAR